MNINVSINLHSYYNKFVNLYSYILINMSYFWAKLCKFYTFFNYKVTNVSANFAREKN